MSRDLTVGLVLALGPAPATQYIDASRRAADLGFGVIELPDHLGMVAPLPTLAAIATAVPDIRVTNHVLNVAFYRPHLLARDIAAVHQLSGGRFITSLGTGYAEHEFATAGIPFPTPGERVRMVGTTALAIRDILADPAFVAPSDLPVPLIRVAGKGDRILASAAQFADMVLVDPVVTETELAERIAYTRANAGERADDITYCFPFTQAAVDDVPDLRRMRWLRPEMTDADLQALPTVLAGTIDEVVAKVRRVRELGVDYVSFTCTPDVGWRTLERLITAVTQDR
jgi:probable F420-dependent oxidoreductase